MDTKKKKKKSGSKVPLPSGSDTDQTILEKQNLVRIPQVVPDKQDTHSVHSESDNEGVKQEELNNLDDEFEKIVPSKIDEIDGIEFTEEDQEIAEILGASENLEKLDAVDDATININIASASALVESEEIEKKIESDTLETEKIDREKEIAAENSANESPENLDSTAVESSEDKITDNIASSSEIKSEEIAGTEIKETKRIETIIDEELLPREAILKFIAEANAEKPVIPLQTYLWEDVKRAKERGGYPWTHIYKQPLGPDEEPEVILNYDRSPKSGRKVESSDTSPKAQKKVRIQEEIEVQEATKTSSEPPQQNENLSTDPSENLQVPVEISSPDEVKKSPKSILKRSQKILDNIKPTTSKFDSDSLKRKIKTPLNRIKKMADQQLKKVKSSGSGSKKIPTSKQKILLNEEVKILKLKESPKSQHREFAHYVVKQDSDDTIDIIELDQSPSELRKTRREVESGIVTPDEIIDLPVSTDEGVDVSENKSDEFKREETPKRKEHHYEDIEDYVSKIAFDSEHVDRVHVQPEIDESNLQTSDPIFDEFSREFNRQIRLSLSTQDDSIRQELKKIPKIEQLAKQISDEDAFEKVEAKNVATEKPKVKKEKLKNIKQTSSASHKSFDGDMEEYISQIAFDSENVDREHVQPEKNDSKLTHQTNISDPIFDEFSREMNKQIRLSLSADDSVRQELRKKIPKIEELEKKISHEDSEAREVLSEVVESPEIKTIEAVTSFGKVKKPKNIKETSSGSRKPFGGNMEEYISQISFDSEHVDRVHVQPEKNESKLSHQTNISDPIFDEFSREMNKQIRLSLSAQDDSLRQELMKKIPKIEELAKQISDEDRETHETPIEVIKSPHLLAPISSIDSTSSDEDRAKLSMVAEESETSDSLKRKSFEHEPSLDILEIEDLKIDDSDVETLIEDIKTEAPEEIKTDETEKEICKLSETESKPVEIAEENLSKHESDTILQEITSEEKVKESLESTDEQNVKEDIIIASNLQSSAAIKINPKWSKMSDHEYEPIGEPLQADLNEENMPMQEEMAQNKRPIDTLEGASSGNEKKLLRTPTEDSEDNISAQDFQDQIENRFFRQEFEPMTDNDELPHPEITLEEAVIIDEEPVHREIPKKKKGFMESAQKSGLTFHKKIKAQASSLKTSLNNKIKKKPKESPVAVEVEEIGDEMPEEEKENIEAIKINVQDVDEESTKAAKQSKLSKLKMNIKKPTMPKFKKGQFTPDFSSLKRLGRSKSMREESSVITTDTSSVQAPEVSTAEPSPRKKFDFGTYPRMIRDKFRRSKLPERSDRSMISDSPAADEDFNRISSTVVRGPVASRWPEYTAEEESGKYQHFDSETDLERERLEFEESRNFMTDEQRQLVDMDRENLQIHLMAKQEKFRKPYIERQESDIASEDDKLMWSGMLNKNVKHIDVDFEENALSFKYQLDEEVVRSSTPKSNQETQSSGSSGTRRRRGYIDDDEDEDYFLREQKMSSSLSREGYIDAALKEGLGAPEENALAQMRDDHEFSPEKPIRSLKRKKKHAIELPQDEEMENFDDYFKTYPPNRPMRKQKSLSVEPTDEEIMLREIHDDASDIIDEHDIGTFKGIEHPDLDYMRDEYDNDMDYNISNMPVPPTPPRRRKKKIRSMLQHQHILSNSNKERPPQTEEIIVFRQEHEFVPLALEEHFTTPTPTPRRTRSRSQMSSYTLDDADSFRKDSYDGFGAMNIIESNKENNKDYATVRKEPPRPVRRKRSTKSLGDRQFATLPLLPKRSDNDVRPPRPPRNYATINNSTPSKPPRRKSAGSLVEISKTIKDDDYEEILDVNTLDNRLSQRLQSGAVVSKMKDRPLPPPPRPKREQRKPKKDLPDDDEKFDKDEGAERSALEPLSIDIVDHSPAKEELEIQENFQSDFLENNLKSEFDIPREESFHDVSSLPRQDSDFSEPERPIEREVSTQTDPLPDEDFAMEDEDIDLEEYLSSDGKIKTLEDILKEEQEAELERARQLAEAENLSKGIQRFRESNQRSFSEKSGKSKSLSRPITPSAVIVERKKSSPIIFEKQQQIMTEAGLFIHPITYDDYGIQQVDDDEEVLPIEQPTTAEEVLPIEQPTTAEESFDVNNNLHHEPLDEATTTSPEPDIAEILKRAQEYCGDNDDDEELDAEMQRKIEEMIESVMSSAKEEAEWLKISNENVTEEQKEWNVEEPEEIPIEEEIQAVAQIQTEKEAPKVSEAEQPPVPPPRRKSTVEEIEETQIIEEDEPSIKIDTLQLEESQAVSEERPSSPFPSRLHLTSLEIDNLSVTQLQAGRISASEIDSHSITTNEFECKLSSTMPNSNTTIEIPPGLIEEIIERVRNAERAEHQHNQQQAQVETSEEAPVRPPLPSQYQPTTQIPPSFYQLRDYSEEEQPHLPAPHRRRKHQPKQRKESTSEEDYQKDQRTRSRTGQASGSSDQSVLGLGGQFLRACGSSLMDSGNHLMEVLRAASKDEQSRDLHIAIIILIIIVAGLFLMGMGEKSIHHHHWDFFNPGENR